jgi:hypothetical protein
MLPAWQVTRGRHPLHHRPWLVVLLLVRHLLVLPRSLARCWHILMMVGHWATWHLVMVLHRPLLLQLLLMLLVRWLLPCPFHPSCSCPSSCC